MLPRVTESRLQGSRRLGWHRLVKSPVMTSERLAGPPDGPPSVSRTFGAAVRVYEPLWTAESLAGILAAPQKKEESFGASWNVVDNKGPKMRKMGQMRLPWNVYENKDA